MLLRIVGMTSPLMFLLSPPLNVCGFFGAGWTGGGAQLPIEGWGVQTYVSFGLKKVDGDWMLVSLNSDHAISEIKAQLEQEAAR